MDFDKKAFERDPVAYLKRHGVALEHTTKHLVAAALGDDAPDGLRAYVQPEPEPAPELKPVPAGALDAEGKRALKESVVAEHRAKNKDRIAAEQAEAVALRRAQFVAKHGESAAVTREDTLRNPWE
jgi:hypothetical protein